jgi:hypothetical protein
LSAFYLRWIKTAFRHSLGPIDLWSSLIGTLFGIADHYFPDWQLLASYGWEIFIWTFAVFILTRLFFAPYWMWQEDEAKRPMPPKARLKLIELRESGVALRNKGASLKGHLKPWLAEIADWNDKAVSAIRLIDEGDAKWFQTLDAVPDARVGVSATGEEHLKAFRELDFCLVRLNDLILKYGKI